MRNATLLLLAGMASIAFLFSADAQAKRIQHPKHCHAYAKTLKVGAAKANPRDRIRQRVYEADSACNPKQDMTWFKDSKGKPILRRKDTYWLPKAK